LSERYFQHTLSNGLVLLGERMSGVQSAAMTLLVPAGVAVDPKGGCGTSTVLSDLVLRGAGARSSRELVDYLDSLGLQRSSSVGIYHTRFSAAAMADRVMEGLSAYADVVQRPHMGEEDFRAARDLALQALEGIDDEPRQKVFILLRQRHFPWPFGRNTMGEKRDLTKLTADACRTYQRRNYPAKGAILAMAGKIDFDALVGQAEKHFGQWASTAEKPIKTVLPKSLVHHERHPSEQTHIGIAWPSVEETHGDYYLMRLATEVLGGGMSGRLFTEVREKRALVYSVWAGYSSIKGSGSILGYAGTSNDRAQATLDTFIAEARRLSEGVTAGELDRAKVGLKAATIMQLESTSSRCGSIAHDFFMRGRIRTLDEIKAAIDSVTLGQVNEFLKRTPPGPFTIVTVGPKKLKVPA